MQVRNRAPQAAGFTLVELLIVSCIILVIIAISSPLFKKTFADLELKETASNVSRLVSYSQQVSIIDVRTYVLAFDFERKRYQLLVETGEGQNRVLNPAGGRFGKLFLVPKDITISGSSNRIFFYPDGHSDKVEIKMEDKNDKSIFVTTTGLLGNSIVREEG